VLDLDLPLIVGVVLVSALAIALVNLLVDIVHVWLDPRLRD
jgi:ABC-type dipeptide/oligopeptide/nickel transport system permease component